MGQQHLSSEERLSELDCAAQKRLRGPTRWEELRKEPGSAQVPRKDWEAVDTT